MYFVLLVVYNTITLSYSILLFVPNKNQLNTIYQYSSLNLDEKMLNTNMAKFKVTGAYKKRVVCFDLLIFIINMKKYLHLLQTKRNFLRSSFCSVSFFSFKIEYL